jgi:hypothetical protein
MKSASDRTDDPIVVSSDDDEDDVTGSRVIHATIVHDDEQDEDEAAQDDESATPDDQPAPGYQTVSSDQTASSDLPRRAWIPERPMPGSHRAGQPVVAQSVPAQRAPFEADPAEPEPDEPATEAPEVSDLGQPAAEPPVSGLTRDDEDEPGQPEAAQVDTDQLVPAEAALAEPALAEPALTEPALTQSAAAEPAPAQPAAAELGSDNPWPEIQSTFVDDPRRAVEQAAKVASTALADLITAAKAVERTLGDDWRNEGTGTEELRVALRGYRDLGGRIAVLTRDFQRS